MRGHPSFIGTDVLNQAGRDSEAFGNFTVGFAFYSSDFMNVIPGQFGVGTRAKHGGFNVPVFPESRKRSSVRNFEVAAQFNKASGYASHGIIGVFRSVLRLLFVQKPNAIVCLVIPISILALNAVLLTGAFTHVCEEVCENQPSITHLDAAPAVAVEVVQFRIAASADHRSPDSVRSSELCPSPRVAMFNVFGCATTRSAFSRSEVDTANWFFFPTIATAEHSFDGVAVARDERFAEGENYELAEAFSDERSLVRHNSVNGIVVFSGGSQLQLTLAASTLSRFPVSRQSVPLVGLVECRQVGWPAGTFFGGVS